VCPQLWHALPSVRGCAALTCSSPSRLSSSSEGMDQATLASAACVLLGTLRAGLRRERAEGGGVVDSGKARERRGRRMAVGVTCVARGGQGSNRKLYVQPGSGGHLQAKELNRPSVTFTDSLVRAGSQTSSRQRPCTPVDSKQSKGKN
jgi:hypothetical protein